MTRSGFVALIGEPNAGKSTLLNQMVGAKISIVTHKVQTTRTRIRGVSIEETSQIIFVDTPGLFKPRRRLDRAMVAAAWSGAADSDLTLLLVEAHRGLTEGVERIISSISETGLNGKLVLVINKIDKTGCGNYHLMKIIGLSSIKNLDSEKKDFLSAAGVPLISPLVDLGNYVMLEIGAPMHVFDLDLLDLPINVFFNFDNEPFQIIGGDLKNLEDSSLTIQDQKGVQAVAGIIGGETNCPDSTITSSIVPENGAVILVLLRASLTLCSLFF